MCGLQWRVSMKKAPDSQDASSSLGVTKDLEGLGMGGEAFLVLKSFQMINFIFCWSIC